MNLGSIISKEEALKILQNDLRRAAMQKRAVELRDVTSAKREAILTEIEREVLDEVQRRMKDPHHCNLLH